MASNGGVRAALMAGQMAATAPTTAEANNITTMSVQGTTAGPNP